MPKFFRWSFNRRSAAKIAGPGGCGQKKYLGSDKLIFSSNSELKSKEIKRSLSQITRHGYGPFASFRGIILTWGAHFSLDWGAHPQNPIRGARPVASPLYLHDVL